MWHTVPDALHRLGAILTARVLRRSDRGDVPGWVLITLMTAAIVGVIWTVAGSDLTSIFHHAVCNATASDSQSSVSASCDNP